MLTLSRIGTLDYLFYKNYILNIIFFDDVYEKEIFSTPGYIDISINISETVKLEYKHGYPEGWKKPVKLSINGDYTKLNKVDYSSKKHFFTVVQKSGEVFYNLYINANKVNLKKEFSDEFNIGTHQEYYDYYSFEASGFYHDSRKKKDGYKNKFSGRIYINVHTKTELTEFGEKCEKLNNQFAELGVNMTNKDIAKLLQNFNIKRIKKLNQTIGK